MKIEHTKPMNTEEYVDILIKFTLKFAISTDEIVAYTIKPNIIHIIINNLRKLTIFLI